MHFIFEIKVILLIVLKKIKYQLSQKCLDMANIKMF